MKGIIFSIEGTDGSGKHTQQQLLSKALKEMGYKVFEQSFPHYDSPSSAPVKMYLGGELGSSADCLDAYQASTLYAVDRMITYKKSIAPHYENGEIVLFDRYVQSNFIHQSSKIEDEDDKKDYISWIDDLEHNIMELPRPDIIFFVEMPVEKSLELAHSRADYKSGKEKDILEEDTDHMTKAYNNGLGLAKKLGWTIVHCVDENGNLKTISEIHKEIMKKVNEYLLTRKIEPIQESKTNGD